MNKIWAALLALGLVFGLTAFAGCADGDDELVVDDENGWVPPVIEEAREEDNGWIPPFQEEIEEQTLEKQLAKNYAGVPLLESVMPTLATATWCGGCQIAGLSGMITSVLSGACLNFGPNLQSMCSGVEGGLEAIE